MKRFCYECNCEQDVTVVRKPEVFPVKGEPIEVISDVVTCDVCGEEIFDESLDEANLARAYQEYRHKHNYLSSAEIKDLRRSYGSGRTVATLLGWSQATIVRYKNGAIPELAHHDQLLLLKQDPNYIRELLERRGDKLKAQERNRLFRLLGPVPAHLDLIQWALLTNGDIDVKPFEGPYEGEVIIASQEPDLTLFSQEELEVINTVAGFFRDFTAAKITEFSHEEQAYTDTALRELIPFSYASTIKLV